MDALTVALQLLFGVLVKKWPVFAGWSNRLVPVFNAILAAVIQALAILRPTEAHAAADSLFTTLPTPIHGHPGWSAVWAFLQPVILNTLCATGIFSSVKNVGGHILRVPHD